MRKLSKNISVFMGMLLMQISLHAQHDVLFNTTPESFPGANDGKIVVAIADMIQNPPPYTFRIAELDEENPFEIQNNTGTATFTSLGYRNYCITVIMGNNCFAYGCFHFNEPCGSEGCLVADFDIVYTFDGCTIQFLDWSREEATSWKWDFGDGSLSNDRNPLHTYSSSGCYNVKLKVSNDTQSREISKEVCISACSEENAPLPDCNINAPSVAAPGLMVNLSVVGTGVAPFGYEWTTPGEMPPFPNGNGQVISALIPEDADNGDQFNFSVRLTDKNGYPTMCVHTITVGGNKPDVEISAFGSFQANQPLVLVAFVDIFNLTGLEDYQFMIWHGNTLVEIVNSCLNVWQPSYGCTLSNGLPEGFYTACVKVRDDAGVYEDCMDVVIGTPVTPPASPAMWLEVKSPSSPETDPLTGHYIVREGQEIRIGIDGSHPAPGFWGCDLNDYFVILKMENLTTSVVKTIGEKFPILNNPGFCDGIPGTCFTGYEDLDWSWPVGVGCTDGTLKITAEVYRVCNNEFECEKAYFITTPIFVDLHPGKPVITDVVIERANCSHPVNVVLSSSCPITSYEWHFYDPYSNEEVTNILEGNPNAKTVYFNLTNPYFYQFPAGGAVKIRCKVVVVDDKGFTAEHVKLLTMLIPLRVDLPSILYRCPNTWSNFSTSSIAVGASNKYEYEWSVLQPAGASLNFSSNNPNDPNPLFLSPLSGSREYKLVVRSVNLHNEANVCQVEKNITVVVSDILLDLPDMTWPICGTLGRQIGPTDLTNLGGSGHYTFDWGAVNQSDLDYLDDIHSSNPLISGIPVGQSITYSLTVTDIYGGCSASDQVTVSSIANDHTVALNGPTSICHRDEVELVAQGAPVNNIPPLGDIFHFYKWTTSNPHHDLSGLGNYVTNLPIDEILSSHPGNYTYTVRYQHFVTGCYAEASINVTIRGSWKHRGFVPKVKSAVAGTPQPLWEGDPLYWNYISSGVNPSQIEVMWNPYPPATVSYFGGNTQMPSNGTFIPTKEVPYLTMTVRDLVTGCSKSFKSIRYVLSDAKPEISITPDKTVTCAIADVCFDIVFDAHLANYSTSLLPPFMPVKVKFDAPDNIFQVPKSKIIYVDLPLVNNSGLYRLSLCEAEFFQSNQPSGGFSDPYLVYVSPVSTFESPWKDLGIHAQSSVLLRTFQPTFSNINTCLPNAGAYAYAHSVNYGLSCSPLGRICDCGGFVFARDYIEIKPDGEVEFKQTTNSWPRGLVFAISSSPTCFPPQFQNPDSGMTILTSLVPQNRDTDGFVSLSNSANANMMIWPNPFDDEVSIRYFVPPNCMGDVTINLIDFSGRHLDVIEKRGIGEPGMFEAAFKTAHLPPGIYFYELVTSGCKIVKKSVKI